MVDTAGVPTGWLLDDDRVLAAIELATTARTRSKGLLGRSGIDGAMLIEPAKQVHTIGMKFAIDVAFVRDQDRGDCVETARGDRHLEILGVVTMQPNRLGWVRWRARSVIEAEAGTFARWGVGAGSAVQIRPAHHGAGQDSTGQDSTGQDSTGQDSTGQAR